MVPCRVVLAICSLRAFLGTYAENPYQFRCRFDAIKLESMTLTMKGNDVDGLEVEGGTPELDFLREFINEGMLNSGKCEVI